MIRVMLAKRLNWDLDSSCIGGHRTAWSAQGCATRRRGIFWVASGWRATRRRLGCGVHAEAKSETTAPRSWLADPDHPCTFR